MDKILGTPDIPKPPKPVPAVKETGKDMQDRRRKQLMEQRRSRGLSSTRKPLMGGGSQTASTGNPYLA